MVLLKFNLKHRLVNNYLVNMLASKYYSMPEQLEGELSTEQTQQRS